MALHDEVRGAPVRTARAGPRARLLAWLLIGAVRVLGWTSLGVQRRCGRVLGWLLWRFETSAARVTRQNLADCFPALTPAQREQLVRQSLEDTASVFAESGVIFHWPTDRWQALAVQVSGADLIGAAHARGRGVLILVPHLGNWEYLSLYLGRHAITALYDPPRNAALEQPIRRARSRTGATLLPIDARGLRAFYRALGGGGTAVLLPDQVPERSAGMYADFFGRPALTMTLAHRLIQRSHPAVLFGVALRVPGGFHVRFTTADAEISAPDTQTSLTAMNAAIAALVTDAPAQYQWEYKRFKRPPPGIPDPYKSGLSAARTRA